MSELLTLTATLNTLTVPVTGQERLVYLLIETGGGSPAAGQPLDLALVIDCSDSMHIKLVSEEQFHYLASLSQASEILNDNVPAWRIDQVPADLVQSLPTRLRFVQQALSAAAEFLQDNDRFSLTAFAGDATPLLPSLPGSQRHKLAEAAATLEGLQLGDGTQLSAGLAVGCASLNGGLGINGAPNSQPIAGRPSAPVNPRTTQPRTGGRPRRVLLLTDGHAQDVSQCYAWAAKARTAGIAITTLGLGSEFNEDLLIPLADMTGGSAYYIENLEQLPTAFCGELENARKMTYQNLEMKLLLPRSVRLRSCYRVQPALGVLDPGPAQEDNSYNLFLGPQDPTAPQALLLECIIPPWQPGNYRLAQVVLAWDDPNPALGRPKQRLDVLLSVTPGPQIEFQARVMNIVERVNAYKLGTQALAAARSGDHTATQQLRQVATRLLKMGEQRLGQNMLAHAESLERAPQADPNATKRLSYETRRLSKTNTAP